MAIEGYSLSRDAMTKRQWDLLSALKAPMKVRELRDRYYNDSDIYRVLGHAKQAGYVIEVGGTYKLTNIGHVAVNALASWFTGWRPQEAVKNGNI